MPFEELLPFLKFDNTKSEKTININVDAFVRLSLSLRAKVKKALPTLEAEYVEMKQRDVPKK
jgi:hypothetical protein